MRTPGELDRRGRWSLLAVAAVLAGAGIPAAHAQQGSEPAAAEKTGWGVTGYPIIFYSPETKAALGAGIALYRARPALRPDVTELEVFGTQMRQLEVNIKQTTFLRGNDYELFGELRFSRAPRMAFWGIGADTPDSAREEYLSRAISFGPRFTYQLRRDVFVGPALLVASYSASDLAPGGLLASDAVRGGRSAFVLGTGVTARWDTADSVFFPTRGFRAEATALLYAKEIGSDHDFAQLALAYRHYIGFGGSHVLAFHALGTLSTGAIPWFSMPRLGGMWMLRGYYEGRYRDNHYFAAQAEYRFPLWWRLSGAVFGATGKVVGALSDVADAPLRAAGGGGLRLLLDRDEHINMRVDVATTIRGDTDFYVSLMEAF